MHCVRLVKHRNFWKLALFLCARFPEMMLKDFVEVYTHKLAIRHTTWVRPKLDSARCFDFFSNELLPDRESPQMKHFTKVRSDGMVWTIGWKA